MSDDPIHIERDVQRYIEHAFREGAQHAREMMARFVEQGGDAATAASIRANWNPAWGDDPGRPAADQYTRNSAGYDYGRSIA